MPPNEPTLEERWNQERDGRLRAEDALRQIRERAEEALQWDDAGDWATALTEIVEITKW